MNKAGTTAVKNEDNSMSLEMRITSLGDGEKTLAKLSATIGGAFAVHGLRLMAGNNKPFLSFPSYKSQNGYVDICYPVTAEFRQRMMDQAMDAYHQVLAQHQGQAQQMENNEFPDPEQSPEMGMQMN